MLTGYYVRSCVELIDERAISVISLVSADDEALSIIIPQPTDLRDDYRDSRYSRSREGSPKDH